MFKKSLLALLSLLLINTHPALAKGGGRIVYDPSNFSKNAASLSTQLKNTAYQAQNSATNAKSLIKLAYQLQKTHEMLKIHQKNIESFNSDQLLNLKQNDLTGYLLDQGEALGVDGDILDEVDKVRRSGSKQIPDSLKNYLLDNKRILKLTDWAVEKLSDPNYQDHGDDYDIYSYIENNKEDLTVDQRVIGNLLAQSTRDTKRLVTTTEELGTDAQAINAAFNAAFPHWDDPHSLTPGQFDEHVSQWREKTYNIINKQIVDHHNTGENAQYIDSIESWAQNASNVNVNDIDSQIRALQLNNEILLNILLAINKLNKVSSAHFRAQAHYWRENLLEGGSGGSSGNAAIKTRADKTYQEIQRINKFDEFCANSLQFREQERDLCNCLLNDQLHGSFQERKKCMKYDN